MVGGSSVCVRACSCIGVCALVFVHIKRSNTLIRQNIQTNLIAQEMNKNKIKSNQTRHIFLFYFFVFLFVWQNGKRAQANSVYPIHLPKSVYALSSTVERIIKINKPSHSCLILNY